MRRRRSWAILASIGAHLGVLTSVLLQHPALHIPVEPGGPPVAIVPLLILPRTRVPAPGHGPRPAPIQLHRRPQRNLSPQVPVAPFVAPTAKPPEAPGQASTPVSPKEPPPPPAPSDAVRATLRATLGCAETRLSGLSRDDPAGCLERLGRGARDAPYLAQQLSPQKRAALDQAGAAKLGARAALERAAPTAQTHPPPSDYDGDPDVAHNAVAPPSFPPSKRAAPVLGRLPP